MLIVCNWWRTASVTLLHSHVSAAADLLLKYFKSDNTQQYEVKISVEKMKPFSGDLLYKE